MEVEQNELPIKPAIDDASFGSLEKEYNEVLGNCSSEKGLDRFKDEYEKLMRALLKSHDSEKRLMRKCRELKAEIVSNSSKVSQATKMSSEDPSNMISLKRDVEKAWRMVEDASEREVKAQDTIDRLKGEIAHLSKLLEMGVGATGVENLADMLKLKEKLLKDKDEQQEENLRLRVQIEESRNRAAVLQNKTVEVQAKISDLTEEVQAKNADAQRELRRKERMEKELKQARSEVESKVEDLRVNAAILEKLKQELRQKEETNRSTKAGLEQANRQLQVTENKLKEAQSKLDSQMQTTDSVMIENQGRLAEVKQKETEVEMARAECNKLVKQRESASKKLRQSEEEKNNLEAVKDRLKGEIDAYDNEAEMMRKAQEADRRACDELTKERELLSKNVSKAVAHTTKQTNLLRMHELSKQNMEQEILNYREEAHKQRRIIYRLERERDKFISDASELTQNILETMDELKLKEMQIFEDKKRIAEAETKLKQQQNLFEAVRSDRNMYGKHLIEAQEDILDMKRKMKIFLHQIEQLKDDVATKDAILAKECAERHKVEKETDQISKDLQKLKLQTAENKALIEAQEAEESKLMRIVADAEKERLRERKEYEQVSSERDILGAQLVKRNEELAVLYEKIRIQQAVLSKGERDYNQHVRELNQLKQEVRKLRTKKAMLQATTTKIDDLKSEVQKVQRQLINQQIRAKSLEEELKNPLNVHRWRKLEGSDPSTYEMILKIHALQKRLITKTEEVVEKELLIQEKEKMYVELKHILARQPGPEVAEQLNIYQTMIKDKTKQIKEMAYEMNQYENQVIQYKGELDILNKEMLAMKKKYQAQKKHQMDPELLGTKNNAGKGETIQNETRNLPNDAEDR